MKSLATDFYVPLQLQRCNPVTLIYFIFKTKTMKIKIYIFIILNTLLMPVLIKCQNIIPTACATQTFNINNNSIFYDDGGPGGLACADGAPFNFCNCGCLTTTTICAPSGKSLQVDFSVFAMFNTTSAFDWMKIYDAPNTSGTVLFNNDIGGADHFPHGGSGTGYGDCGDDVPPAGLVSSCECLTFEFNATGVVNREGWEAAVHVRSTGCLLLPINLIAFEVEVKNRKVGLSWKMSSEGGQNLYVLEKSADAVHWESFAEIEGKSSSAKTSYFEVDFNPLPGASYYRLKIKEFNGDISYSAIRSVDVAEDISAIHIYPNPVKDHLIIEGDEEEMASIKIYNNLGQDMGRWVQSDYLSSERRRLNISSLSQGIYTIRTRNRSRRVLKL